MKALKHHFHSPALGLFMIRLVAGVIFIYHGISKLSDMPSTVGFFASLGLGAFFAWLVALVELLGGVSLILGLWSRFFGALLAIVMVVALLKVKIHMGFLPAEIDFMLLATSVAVLFSGCGRYSVCAYGHNCNDCADKNKCGCQHGM
jgi:uncharacterized membrane protein YphA (DoxX/SURF4 family)